MTQRQLDRGANLVFSVSSRLERQNFHCKQLVTWVKFDSVTRQGRVPCARQWYRVPKVVPTPRENPVSRGLIAG